jgi:hypothetical protein
MIVSAEDPNAVDHDLFYTPDLLGAECASCFLIKRFNQFDRDTSYRSWYKPQCRECLAQPRLSMEEHASRLKQLNFNSEGTRRQRHEDQEEFRKTDARYGRRMHASVLLLQLQKLVPSLFIKEGRIEGDLALYQVADQPQTKWEGKNFKYLGSLTYYNMPEYDIFSFDEKLDVVIRPEEVGWRTVLLRLIKADLLTEEICNKQFGYPTGRGSGVWYKQLYKHKHNRPENGQAA